jgi:DNA polymerase-3 subunit beta
MLEVLFEFSAPSRAVLVSPTTQNESEDLLMLVMPIMVN